MAIAKTTDRDVKNILDTDKDTTPYIEVAQLLVDEILATSALTIDRQNAIVRYLAAHFCWLSITNGLVAKDVGTAREVYRTFSDKSEGLGTSRFGQTALSLDTTGTLASKTANNGLKALFNVIPSRGNPPRWVTNQTQDVPDPWWS